ARAPWRIRKAGWRDRRFQHRRLMAPRQGISDAKDLRTLSQISCSGSACAWFPRLKTHELEGAGPGFGIEFGASSKSANSHSTGRKGAKLRRCMGQAPNDFMAA